MKTSVLYRLIILILIVAVASCKKDKEEEPQLQTDLPGQWAITGTLVTTTNPDPNAPQAGFQMTDTWIIGLNNGVPSLTSQEGSITGSVIGTGYHFEGQYDVLPNIVWVTFMIEVFPGVQYNQLYGTQELRYWGVNGVGQPMILGTESWKIAGSKQ